jgi:hypothetical protein
MGWSRGSEIAAEVWDLVKEFVPTKKRKSIAKQIVDLFEDNDCDTMYEAEDLMEAAGLTELAEE